MNLKTIKTKTVSATTPQDLDAAIEEARQAIVQRNERAQLVSFHITSNDTKVYATIVWAG